MATKTPFPLGVYLGGPNGNDPGANANFELTLDQFSQFMGIRPAFMDTYTDNSFGDPSTWAGSAGWNAWPWAQTGSNYVGPGFGVVPVVGVPMSWAGEDWNNVDAAYKDSASGNYDLAIKGIVDAWIDNGYKVIQFRVGYEFNISSISWNVLGSNVPSAGQDFVAAFRRMADTIHAEATARGATAQVVWNPGTWESGNTPQLYPGDQYVDLTSLDEYSPTWTQDFTDWASGGTYKSIPRPGPAARPTGSISGNIATPASRTRRRDLDLRAGRCRTRSTSPGCTTSPYPCRKRARETQARAPLRSVR